MLPRFLRTGSGFSSRRPTRIRPALRVEPLEDRTVLDHGLASPAIPLSGPPFAEIVAFGDSLTDTGNVFIATGGAIPASPPYFEGHFSNGPVWVEYLADDLGLPRPEPFLGGGTNYAVGNAETGFGFTPDGVPNVGTQIDLFLDGNTLHGDELVVVWAGANDFIRGGELRPWVPVRNLARHITTLADAGATTILTANLPPLGLLPAFRDQPLRAALLNLETVAFNRLLDFTLNRLDRSLPGVDILRLDVFGLVVEGAADPGAFGFTNVRDPALQPDGSVVPNVEEYFWWDDIHPTTRAHELLGAAAAEVILSSAGLGQVTDSDPAIGDKASGGRAGLAGSGVFDPDDLPNQRRGDSAARFRTAAIGDTTGFPPTTRKGLRQPAVSPLDPGHDLRDAVFTLLGARDPAGLPSGRRK